MAGLLQGLAGSADGAIDGEEGETLLEPLKLYRLREAVEQ